MTLHHFPDVRPLLGWSERVDSWADAGRRATRLEEPEQIVR